VGYTMSIFWSLSPREIIADNSIPMALRSAQVTSSSAADLNSVLNSGLFMAKRKYLKTLLFAG